MNKTLLWLLIASTCIRLGLAWFMNTHHPENFVFDDTKKLFLYGELITQPPLLAYEPRLSPNITPAYPALIEAVKAIMGDRAVFALIVLQCFLLTGATALVYLIARRLFNAQTGLIAAALFSFDIAIIQFSLAVLTEITALTFLLLALWLGVKLIFEKEEKAYKNALSFSGMLAFSALWRGISYYLMIPVLAALPLCARLFMGWRWRSIFIAMFCLAGPWLLITQGWASLLESKTGIHAFSTSGTYQLFTRRAPDTLAAAEGMSFQDAQAALVAKVPAHDSTDLKEKYDQMGQAARDVIETYPLVHVQRSLAGLLRLMLVPGEAEFLKEVFDIPYPSAEGPAGDLLRLPLERFAEKWGAPDHLPFLMFFIVCAGFLYCLYLTCAFGYINALRSRENLSAHLFLGGVLIYLILVSSGIESHARYRVPIMPLVYIYSSYTIYVLVRRLNHGRHA